jgi:hypothetical protein
MLYFKFYYVIMSVKYNGWNISYKIKNIFLAISQKPYSKLFSFKKKGKLRNDKTLFPFASHLT